jgi:hypothetical protein
VHQRGLKCDLIAFRTLTETPVPGLAASGEAGAQVGTGPRPTTGLRQRLASIVPIRIGLALSHKSVAHHPHYLPARFCFYRV